MELITVSERIVEALRAADRNLLDSVKGIGPEDVHRQAAPMLNTISWILGHCLRHHQLVLGQLGLEEVLETSISTEYYRFGTTKKEISERAPPCTFAELIEEYSRLSKECRSYAANLDERALSRIVDDEPHENLGQKLIRLALHVMGHAGQIVLLRRILGTPGPSFVGAIADDDMIEEETAWSSWWEENRLVLDV